MKMTMIHKINKIKFFLIMLVMGVGSAWAQTEITSLSQITDMSGNYKLTADIDASGNTTLGTFTGTLDGDFHTISGLSNAIFTTVSGTVKNIILDNVSISGGQDVGAIANTASGNARIYNCGVLATTGSSISGTRYVGSIVGALSNNARVLNCFSYANVSGGSRVAGIVGSNGGTAVDRSTILNGTGSMVFNCMFFGKITSGTYKYPVYGGTTIENVYNTSKAQTTGINTYNYFLYDGVASFTNVNSAAGVINTEYLSRFNLYRDMLNSHRDLCAMYINNTQSLDAEKRNDIALWQYSHETKETIPYLHLEKLQTNTQSTLNRTIPSTAEDYKGKQVGTVNCTFVINGSSRTVTLPMTDMDTDNWDYTWGKIILPFANEFSGWTLPASGSNDYDKIITGWEITSITGGTLGAAPTAANHYNLCDPNCTAKDLYSNTNYVWAQGGYYVVPNDVTSITFTAHIVNAYYLCDPYPDEASNAVTKNNKTTPAFIGTQLSGEKYNGKTVYHTFEDVYKKLESKNNPADQAIVLVGNYHLDTNRQSPGTTTDQNVWTNANASRAYQAKAATIMSIDADNNQVPDYAFVSAVTYSTGRSMCPPTRFDFVCCPGRGISSYTRNGMLPDFAIMHSAGWFEVTETAFLHMTEYEVRPQAFTNSNSPCILNGGIYEKFILGTNLGPYSNDANVNFSYFKFGGKVYITDFKPAHKSATDINSKYASKPVNVCGGQIDECYMAGKYFHATNSYITGDAYFFANGGYIKTFQGADQGQLRGNLTTEIRHAIIDEFYGGGAVPKYTNNNNFGQITGNISNTIEDSYVKFFVAGPKFGDMGPGKTVTTVAKNTTFGQYFGAGYGGTALTAENAITSGTGVAFGSGESVYSRAFTYYTNYRLSYVADNGGVCVGYDRQFYIYAGGGMPGTQNGNAPFTRYWASLSLAQTHNVSSIMTNCTFENDFYGGGHQGMVNGTVTNILTDCTVAGSVFGGGYKAEATPIYVYPTTEPTKSVFKGSMGFFTPFGTIDPETYTWVSGTDGAVDNTAKTIGTSVDMSQMGLVTGAISTTINGGTVGANVFGGGNESPSDNNATVIIKGNAQVAQDAFGGGNIAPVGGNTNITLGEADVADNTQVTRAIYGGGALANVGGNTTVNLLGGKVTDVYGGGLGRLADAEHGITSVEAIVSGNTTVTLNGSIVNGEIFGCNNLNGTPQGHAKVHVLRTTRRDGQGDDEYDVAAVYGGGNLSAYEPSDETYAANMGFAEVLIENCDNSIEYVYGGGNAAPVPATKVTIMGANAIDNAFAGGNGAGEGNPGADIGYLDYTRNDPEKEYGTGVASIDIKGGTIHHVYGGSNTLGYIRDHAEVNVEANGTCTMDITELYGGGKMAPGKAATINIVCTGENGKIDNVYGGAHMADLTGDIELNIRGGKIGNVFGGNNNSGRINGAIEVNIDWATGLAACGENSLTNVYGGGNLAAYTTPDGKVGPTVNLKNGTVTGNVYGGGLGEAAVVTGNPVVNISGGTVGNNVFGGGSLALTAGNPAVNVSGGTVTHDVYGGGALANVTGSTAVNLTGGAVGGAYGGALGAKNGVNGATADVVAIVTGNTTVTLGKEIDNGDGTKSYTASKVTETGIFGANNLNGTPKGHAYVHVLSTTPRDGEEYDVPAVYGGGNLSAYEPTSADDFAEVLIEKCDNSIEYVYGGGKAAPVPATKVVIYGANAINHAFAGGNGAGAGNPGADVGYLGYKSSGSATEYGTGVASIMVYGGTVKNVYGGSNTKGYIRNGTFVSVDKPEADDPHIPCELKVGNVFGGGNEADIDCDIVMDLNCNEGGDVLFAGANNANVYGDVILNIHSGTYGKVFSGNNEGGQIFGKIEVNVDETGCWPIMIGELYGGGNLAPYSVYGFSGTDAEGKFIARTNTEFEALTDAEKTAENFSNGRPYDAPTVNLISFTRIGKVFGGGYGEDAVVYGNTIVNVNPIKGVFAGYGTKPDLSITPAYILDSDDRRVTNNSPYVIPDEVGSIGSIYGGGNAGPVVGNTYVNIGTKDTNMHLNSDIEQPVQVIITGNVYGASMGKDGQPGAGLVTGETNVVIGNND